MPKYDFHALMEPLEFQRFAIDVIDVREKTNFEVFSEAKDLGIDAYKITKNGITIVVQAKRVKDFKSLFSILKTDELPKIKKLNIDRYILITSSTISKTQKSKILELLDPYVINSEDIIAKDDLNKYLTKEKYKEIELNYPSLWFNSANTFLKEMTDIVNHSIYEETIDELEKIKQSMKNYVIPENFSKIINSLNNSRVLLITGNPGIGKTSLGRALSSYYITKDYELIYTKEIDKANQVYKRDNKQIFFLDDYWGSSFKDKNYSHIENTKFINFVDKISNSNNKILIITSRDYIIKQVDEDLKRILINKEYLLDIKKISLNLRYKILYKYLSTSDINYSYIEYILENVEEIIKHNNFNPRIIEMYINSTFHLEVNKYKYLKYLVETLNSPISFLDEIYQKQTKEAKLLLYLMLTIEPPILLKDLEEAYLNIINASNKNYDNYNLENIISQLEKNFIRTYYINNKGIVVDFINNSIIDYLYDCNDNFKEFEFDIINNLTYFNQIIFFLKNKDNILKLPVLSNSYITLKNKLISNINNLNIIIGSFYDTIEYYNITSREQLIYKILKLSNIDNLDKEIVELIIEKYNLIIKALDNKDRCYIYKDNLSELLRLYKKITKYIDVNKKEYLDIYYKNIKHTFELYLLLEDDAFQNELKHKLTNKEKVIEFYKSIIYYDLEYYYDNKMYQSLEELYFLLETDLYDVIKDDDELLEAVEYYDNIPKSYYAAKDEIMDKESLKDNYDINEKLIVKELKINKSTSISFNKYIKNLLSPEEIKDLKKHLNKNKYLKSFKNTKEKVDILLYFYKNYHCFPNSEEEFYKILITTPTITSDIKNSQYIMLTLAYILFTSNKPIFKKEDILEVLLDLKINKKEVFKLLDTILFKQEEEWYCFATKELQAYCLSLYVSCIKDNDKEEFYNGLISALVLPVEVDFEYIDDLDIYYDYFQKNDKEGFIKYFIYEILNNYLSKTNKQDEDKIITSIIEFFHFELSLKELSYSSLNGYSYINAEIMDVLELLTGEYIDLQELIPKEAFEEFINKFKENIEFKNNNYYIDLIELTKNKEFFNYLRKYNINDKIMSSYNKIIKEVNYIEKEYYVQI